MSFVVGENVGPYRILSQLGQGGMATVFKAYHAALDRYVAIKVLHRAFLEDSTFLARFQREARVVAKLEHANIVPVHDFAEHEGQPYLVMRFIEGETLKARLGRGPLTRQETMRVIEAVGAALSHAHAQGILHRDIKPSNILLSTDGNVYLADFGLARIAQAGASTLSSDMLMGTPHYISPEQARGERNLDVRTDIYSFGVVLYELAVGRVPFSADTPFSIIHDHIYTPLPLPRAINPRVPEAVERVLLKALAKDRGDRFESVEELVSAFRSALGPGAGPAWQPTSPKRAAPAEPAAAPPHPTVANLEAGHRKTRRWAGIVASVIVACLCLAAAALVLNRARARRAAAPPATPSASAPTTTEAVTPTAGEAAASPTPSVEPPVLLPAAAGIPQECGLAAPDFGVIGVGAVVILGRHRAVAGDDFWSVGMDAYLGRPTLVTDLDGVDRSGCPGARVEADGGYWFWRIRDMQLVSPSPPPGAAGMPQLCGLTEETAVYGPLQVGARVVLARHRPYGGDDFWSPGMDTYVGRETAVASLAGVDRAGCPGVRVEADGGYWFWRVRDLTPLP